MTNATTLLATAALVLTGLIVCLPTPPESAQTLTLIFPPWWSRARVWRAASGVGEVVDVAAAAFVIVLHSDRDDLAARARRAGALLAIEPGGLGACGLRSGRAA